MVRIPRAMMLPALAGVTVLCFCAVAEAQAGGAAPRQWMGQSNRMYVPGHHSLASESMQKELNITEKQLAKLQEISKSYRGQPPLVWNRQDYKGLTREELAKKFEEYSEERRKRTAEFTKQVEDVLTRRQLDELKTIEKTIELRRSGVNYLTSPRTAEKLGLSEEQVQKIQENRKALSEATKKLRRESAKKALDILTPEQLEGLKKLHAEGYRSLRGQPYQRPKTK